jgi:hypothetical protein
VPPLVGLDRCPEGAAATASTCDVSVKSRATPSAFREDAMLRGLAARITLDGADAAGTTSPQDALEFLLSNAMVVEIYSATRRLLPLATDGQCLDCRRAFPDPGKRWGNSVSEGDRTHVCRTPATGRGSCGRQYRRRRTYGKQEAFGLASSKDPRLFRVPCCPSGGRALVPPGIQQPCVRQDSYSQSTQALSP